MPRDIIIIYKGYDIAFIHKGTLIGYYLAYERFMREYHTGIQYAFRYY